MNNHPSLLFQFDEAWTPTVFINGPDTEIAKLKEIAALMLVNFERPTDED